MIDTLLAPFQFSFMQNAFLGVMLIAIPTAYLSCFLVLKGWALLGDAISHAVFPGVVLAYILNLPFVFGAFVAGLFCALATGFIHENSRVKQDTVMGVVFSGMFAIGLVLYTKIESDVHLDHILYGNVLGISGPELISSAILAILILVPLILRNADFKAHSFDPAHTKTIGLANNFLHFSLLVMISLAVVASLQAVGLILAIAFLVTPGGIAFLITRRFETMVIVAICVSLLSSFLGVYLSFFLNSAPAPTIVLVMTLIFVLALISTGKLAQMRKRG